MKKKHGVLIALACAGACAIPLAAPLLAGASLAVVGGALLKPSGEVIACGALAFLAVALLFGRRRKDPPSCSADGSCGCRPGHSEAR
jgi:MYXO-CTERM domain-containing protein